MKNASTGNIIPADRTDWSLVRAMQDADIHHDADSPSTKVSDWEGATQSKSSRSCQNQAMSLPITFHRAAIAELHMAAYENNSPVNNLTIFLW